MCFGGSSAKTDRTTQLANTGKAQDIGSYLTTIGKKLEAGGEKTTEAGLSDLGKSGKYYSDILSGDPNKVLAAVAPAINNIVGQSDQAKTGIARGGNRTGGTNEAALSIGDKTRAAVSDTISKAKPGAASGLAATGSEIASIGTTQTGQGLGATTSAGSLFMDLVNSAIKSRGQSQEINQAAQQQWADVAALLLFG